VRREKKIVRENRENESRWGISGCDGLCVYRVLRNEEFFYFLFCVQYINLANYPPPYN
jgi:hypothetical protein